MVQLSDLTWPAVEALPRSTPVVIPVAALEQHGGHMPLFTDSLLLGEVVRRASSALEGQALFAPLMWLGNSHHHMDFPGTLSASPRVYLDLLVDLMENFLFHGFRRIILLNGHGGNITPGKQAVFEVRQKYRQRTDLLLLFSTYWETADPCEGRTDLVQTSMGHACEWETSMILRLAPHLVGPIDGLEPVSPNYSFEPAYRGWTTKDRTKLGYIGDPRRATAEKGEHLFEVFTQGVVRHVRDVAGWDGHTWFPPERA